MQTMMSCVTPLRRADQPGARVEAVQVDLTDLDSIRSFAGKALDAGRPLDVLINNAGQPTPSSRALNLALACWRPCGQVAMQAVTGALWQRAGVMACPELRTKDGFELQLATNHLGHFLLTTMLLPLLTDSSR